MDKLDPRKRVNTAILESGAELRNELYRYDDSWYGLAVSDIALLLDTEDEIRFVDVRTESTKGGDAVRVRLIVITSELVIRVSGQVEASKQGERTCRAWSRRDLESIGVKARRGAFDDEITQGAWPGGAEVSLSYRDERSFSIPSVIGNADVRRRVLDLLPSLRADLLAR